MVMSKEKVKYKIKILNDKKEKVKDKNGLLGCF